MIGRNFNTFSESTSVEFRDADVSHLLAIASASGSELTKRGE
jgi:hypothetical protein